MNLEEYAELMREKKPRKLVDIDVDEITLCASAANRKKFFITKMEDSVKDFDEILDLVVSFLSDNELEKSEEVDTGKLKEAIHVITDLRDEIPDELRSAISIVLKWAASYGVPTKKSQTTDIYPSIPIVAPASVIERMAENIDDEDIDGE